MKDVVRYHPVPGMPGMVLGQARITEFQFDRHYHVDYHIGLVTQGDAAAELSRSQRAIGTGRRRLDAAG